MPPKRLFENISILLVFLFIATGCKFINFNQNSAEQNKTQTPVTKEILQERLTKKGVKISPINPNSGAIFLNLKIIHGYAPPKFKLNENELMFPELVMKLNSLFIDREKNGIFEDGTNVIYKRITLSATPEDISFYNKENIFVEDFEKAIDDLQKEKFDQLYINFDTLPIFKTIEPKNTPPPFPSSENSAKTNSNPVTISGGVVNGKAVNLVTPPYPPAARAVRASGPVSVEVVIDEEGNVFSAQAISGHPLLKTVAETAAKASKFSPTLLGGKIVRVKGVIVYNFTANQ